MRILTLPHLGPIGPDVIVVVFVVNIVAIGIDILRAIGEPPSFTVVTDDSTVELNEGRVEYVTFSAHDEVI